MKTTFNQAQKKAIAVAALNRAKKLNPQRADSASQAKPPHKSRSGMEALYLGAYEQVSRISALLACWGGVREAEHVRWAFETVRRDVQAKALAVTANDRAKDSPQTALQARIVSLCGGETGMTMGVLVNRCRKFRREDVEKETAALVAQGALRAESFKSANGKETERFTAN